MGTVDILFCVEKVSRSVTAASQRSHAHWECSLQRSKSMQVGKKDEQEGMKQQQRMNTMTDIIRNIKAKGSTDADTCCGVSELLACWLQKA